MLLLEEFLQKYKYRFSEEIIEKLMQLQWWKYNYHDFAGVDFTI